MSNYRSLLRKAIEVAQEAEPGLTLKEIARRASISRSLLSLVLNEKRHLTLSVATGLARVLKVDPLNSRKLLLLVQLDETQDPSQRKKLERELASIYEHEHSMELRLPEGLAADPELRWLAYLIFATKTMSWSKLDTKKLVKLSQYKEEQISYVLSELKSAGFLTQNTRGEFLIKDFRSFGEKILAKQLMQNSVSAYDVDGENDLFSAVSFPVTKANVEQAEKLMQEFVRQMMSLRHDQTDPSEDREIYQLVVAFHNILPERPGKKF